MSNKRVAILVVLVVVLVLVCIMAVGPALMDAVRGIHVIPPH
jgi:hypothetical protein